MSRVLPAEGDLRRVIGDGAAVPDGEVDGLSADELISLYRDLVLLRTYDERSVVYHRQGRIGTYAIFWGHEAMQVGSSFALERAARPALQQQPVGDLDAAQRPDGLRASRRQGDRLRDARAPGRCRGSDRRRSRAAPSDT